MKKVYGIIMVMLSLVLVGCGTNSQGSGQKAIDAFLRVKLIQPISQAWSHRVNWILI